MNSNSSKIATNDNIENADDFEEEHVNEASFEEQLLIAMRESRKTFNQENSKL